MSDILEVADVRELPDDDRPPPTVPDYELPEKLVVDQEQQLKAFGDPVRRAILDLVLERAATTTELALALGRPKGTVDHHLKVLERAGLVRVVRSRKVRALTECFWGRTARTFHFGRFFDDDDGTCSSFLRDAQNEIVAADRSGRFGPDDEVQPYSTLRHARIAPDRMNEFVRRLDELAVEFVSTERGGDTVYGLLLVTYPTTHAVLGEPR